MVVTVADRGVLTVSSSQLLHDVVIDPFPCVGQDMHCVSAHSQAVVVNCPASINMAAPLVCADQSSDSCLSGYVDMPSCLADVAGGMSSCFVYLQSDALSLGQLAVARSQYFEVHGRGGGVSLQLQADWSVGDSASLVLADLRLLGGDGYGCHLSVDPSGQLTMNRIQMQGGDLTFSGIVSVTDSTLTSSQLLGSTASAALSLSGGTLTGSTATLSAGSATVTDSCVMVNSPLSISAGLLSVLDQCELRSDGSSVPLAVEAGGSATVTGVMFRSTAGDDITAVSVEEGGSLSVADSQLVKADGSADPFPCDGTLPDCVGAHAGAVAVDGPAAITLASPLVCDAVTGECLSDMCFVVDCPWAHTCVSPLGTCLPCCSVTARDAYTAAGRNCNCGPCRCAAANCASSDCAVHDCRFLDWCDQRHPGWDSSGADQAACDRSC